MKKNLTFKNPQISKINRYLFKINFKNKNVQALFSSLRLLSVNLARTKLFFVFERTTT